MSILILIISTLANLLVLLVIVQAILTFILDPYHPIRRLIDPIVEPMLMPIRRVIPPVAMLDFSPVILIVLIRILSNLLVNLLR